MSKKQFSVGLAATALLLSALAVVSFAPDLYAATLNMADGASQARGVGQPAELFGSAGVLTSITSLLLYIVGALSVIMIIFGGLRYVVSGGNTASVAAAKNTILYAIVGIVVSLLAYAMVNFVLGALLGGGGAGSGTNV
jgi:hypothetical protein